MKSEIRNETPGYTLIINAYYTYIYKSNVKKKPEVAFYTYLNLNYQLNKIIVLKCTFIFEITIIY